MSWVSVLPSWLLRYSGTPYTLRARRTAGRPHPGWLAEQSERAAHRERSKYTLDREREDLLAVQAATGARTVFGHSYGGLIVLHAAARTEVFARVAVYEPGVDQRVDLDWLDR